MRLGADDRGALAVPASHVTGLIATIATMVHVGATIVVLAEFKAADFLARVEAERVTHTLMVPAMYKLCLLAPDFARRDLASWRIGGYGGAPMPVATIDALAEALPGMVARQRLRRHRDDLADDDDAGRPDARPCRHRRRRAAVRRDRRHGRRRPRGRRRRRPASSGSAGRWSSPATGTTPPRPPRRSPPASGTRATSARSTAKATSASSIARRTCSIAAASRSIRSRSRTR